jgi:hypothetical protein
MVAALDPAPTDATAANNTTVCVVGSELAVFSAGVAHPSRGGGQCRGIYVEVQGALQLTFADGTTDTYGVVPAGVPLPFAVTASTSVSGQAGGLHFLY